MTTFGERLDLAILTIYDEYGDLIFEYSPRVPDYLRRNWFVQCADLKPDQMLFVIQAHVRLREGERLPCSTTTLDNFEVDLGTCAEVLGWRIFFTTPSVDIVMF